MHKLFTYSEKTTSVVVAEFMAESAKLADKHVKKLTGRASGAFNRKMEEKPGWEEFEKEFKPRVMDPDKDDTYGRFVVEPIEMDRALKLPEYVAEKRLWTVLDCDGLLILSPGRHYVNRFGFVVSEAPWTEKDEQRSFIFM